MQNSRVSTHGFKLYAHFGNVISSTSDVCTQNTLIINSLHKACGEFTSPTVGTYFTSIRRQFSRQKSPRKVQCTLHSRQQSRWQPLPWINVALTIYVTLAGRSRFRIPANPICSKYRPARCLHITSLIHLIPPSVPFAKAHPKGVAVPSKYSCMLSSLKMTLLSKCHKTPLSISYGTNIKHVLTPQTFQYCRIHIVLHNQKTGNFEVLQRHLHPQCQCLQDLFYQVIMLLLARTIMLYVLQQSTLHHTNFIIHTGNTHIHKLVYRYLFIYLLQFPNTQ